MLRFTLVEPKETENAEDILWHNIRVADELHNLQMFIGAASGWFALNPEKNFQDLERELRERDLNTHLIAKKPGFSGDFTLRIPVKDREQTKELIYECIYSCRPKEFALEELHEFAENYDDNFEKLALAGSVTVNDTTEVPEEGILSDKAKTGMELLAENSRKIEIEKVTADMIIGQIQEQYRMERGENPELRICGMGPNGQPVMAFCIGSQVIADVGVMMDAVTDSVEIVPLRDYLR